MQPEISKLSQPQKDNYWVFELFVGPSVGRHKNYLCTHDMTVK